MNITITKIDIETITNIGSLNIGKTILCHNRSSTIDYPSVADDGQEGPSLSPAETVTPAEVPTPAEVR